MIDVRATWLRAAQLRRALLVAGGVLLSGAVVALAFWTITVLNPNSKKAQAVAASLSAPTAPTATANGSGAITVGWTLPASQLTGAQYQVTRTSPGAATTVCTVASTVTSCQDTGLTAHTTYSYSIIAVLSNWQTTAITASTATSTPAFTIALSSSPYTASTAITVTTITAKIGSTTDTTYSGTKTLNWTGLANSPSSQAPSYPSSAVTFTNGVASPSSPFTAYAAGSNTLTATDSGATSVTGSVTFTVGASTLNGFTVPTPATQTANVGFSETITAIDSWGNVASGWTSITGCVTLSGPLSSPNSTAPTYPATGTCGTGNSSLSFNASGQATATITLVDAQSTTLMVTSVTAPAGKTGVSGSFTVNPGTLNGFTVPTPSTQTVGVAFNETLTAIDTWGNAASGWISATDCVVFSGPANSPNGTAPTYPAAGTCGTGNSSLSFNASGQATASITLYDVQSATLTVTSVSAVVGKTGASSSFTVSSGTLNSFTVPTPSTQTAGALFSETITARDAGGNVATGWTSVTNCVTFSGPASSPNSTAPAYPAAGSCGTGNSSLSFNASGQATASITLYDAQSTTLTVTSVSAVAGKTGASSSFTVVNKNALNSFTLSPSTPTPTAGTAFTVSLTALDQYSNTDTNYTGAQCVTFSGPANGPTSGSPTYPAKGSCAAGSSVTFASGVANGGNAASITLVDAQTVILTATDNPTSKTGTTSLTVGAATLNSFTVPTPSTQNAGSAFSETITALDSFGNVASGWTSVTNCVTFSGPSNSPNGTAPAYPAAGSCGAGNSSLSFNGSGQATASITLYDAQSTTLTVTSVTAVAGKTGASGSFTVNALSASHLAWTSTSSTHGSLGGICYFTCTYTSVGGSGTTFKAKISLTDTYGNLVSASSSTSVTVSNAGGGSFTGSATVTISSGSSTSSAGGDGNVAGEITFVTASSGNWGTNTLSMSSTPSFTGAAASFSK